MKRRAAGTKSAKSRKKHTEEAPAASDEAPFSVAPGLADIDSAQFLDEAIPLLREVILRQMKENKTKPAKIETANRRARDSATLSGLVRTLDKLNALDKSREKKSRKAKAKHDAELKERFVRRLDQLLAAGQAPGAAAEPERG